MAIGQFLRTFDPIGYICTLIRVITQSMTYSISFHLPIRMQLTLRVLQPLHISDSILLTMTMRFLVPHTITLTMLRVFQHTTSVKALLMLHGSAAVGGID